MSSLSRMLSVLNLFSAERAVWDAEEVAVELDCSVPTTYRYLKELVNVGLLQRLSAGQYALGPRIALLDYVIRTSDPLMNASIGPMRRLAKEIDCACVLSRLDGGVCLDIHHEGQSGDLRLTYGRGRPRPLFKGASPKVILAHLPSRKLRQLYDAHQPEVSEAGLGEDWAAFRQSMSKIKKEGVYVSNGELDGDVSAMAMPLIFQGGDMIASLAIVAKTVRFALIDLDKLGSYLSNAVRDIQNSYDLSENG